MSQNTRRRRRASTVTPKRHRNATALRQHLAWLLPTAWLAGVRPHGNTRWTPTQLVIQALCWTWSEGRTLAGAFEGALEWCDALHLGPALTTYQGFMGALVGWSATLIRDVLSALHRHLAALPGPFYRIGPWIPIAFDGSRSSAPRTVANERAFCAPNHGHGRTAKYPKKKARTHRTHKPHPPEPQVWITMLWHVGLRLPWVWRLGPSHASEREHVMDVLAHETFPEGTLFCGDAGFVGYPLWSRIQQRGHQFLVRAGANVHLLVQPVRGRIKDRPDQLVLSWPQSAQQDGSEPLHLRLIQVRIKKTRVWLLTSVLDRPKLTLAQAVELYQKRWGIEVAFRGLKHTLARGELRCRDDARARVELDWSLVGMAVVELWALKAQLDARARLRRHRRRADAPVKRSLAASMRAVRWCARNASKVSKPGAGLVARLASATTDEYVRTRSKRARYRPANPDKKPLGAPKLRTLTTNECRKLKKIQAQSTG
jgi:hypothetical protein